MCMSGLSLGAMLAASYLCFIRGPLLLGLPLLVRALLIVIPLVGALFERADFYRFSGFLFWSAASALTDTMHVYWRMFHHFFALETIHSALNQGTVIFWIVCAFKGFRASDQHTSDIEVLEALF